MGIEEYGEGGSEMAFGGMEKKGQNLKFFGGGKAKWGGRKSNRAKTRGKGKKEGRRGKKGQRGARGAF